MILTTCDSYDGRATRTLGLVRGNTIRSKHLGRDIGASLKSLVGGELRAYTEMMTEARDEATQRMLGEASALDADAVIGVRYTTSMVIGGASEILAYGTAVKFA